MSDVTIAREDLETILLMASDPEPISCFGPMKVQRPDLFNLYRDRFVPDAGVSMTTETDQRAIENALDALGYHPRHILRPLPPKPEDHVPPATTTAEPTKWYVWSRAGGPPNVKHSTHEAALAEAHRLAAHHPGREFKVLGQVGETVVASKFVPPKPEPTYKPGDRVLVEAVVVDAATDIDGDMKISTAHSGRDAGQAAGCYAHHYAHHSALRPLDDGGGE